MKKRYEKPCLQLDFIDFDTPLLAGSGTAHTDDNSTVVIPIYDETTEGPVDAKRNNSIWDDD